jgi:hypothetical protein
MTPDSPTQNRRLRIFLCHGHEDKDRVLMLYQQLNDEGFQPWMDEEDLLPGQDWQAEIRKAVRQSDAFVVCLSSQSTTRAGFIHREIAFAMDVADEQPEETLFIIPLKLEPCTVPEKLAHLHWGLLSEKNGYQKLVKALRRRMDQLRISLNPTNDSVALPVAVDHAIIMDKSPVKSQIQDIFAQYEIGLDTLIARIEKQDPCYTEMLVYEHRLRENIVWVRQFGDDDTRRSIRNEIIAQLNRLALDVLGVSFNELTRGVFHPRLSPLFPVTAAEWRDEL